MQGTESQWRVEPEKFFTSKPLKKKPARVPEERGHFGSNLYIKKTARELCCIWFASLGVCVSNSSPIIPCEPHQLSPSVDRLEVSIEGMVESAALYHSKKAKFKSTRPELRYLSDSEFFNYGRMIQTRLATDKADVKLCLESGCISRLRNNQVVSEFCIYLKSTYQELFDNAAHFKAQWEKFTLSPLGKACEADWKGQTPLFDLNSKAYHNSDHANEMFADTIVKLHKAGLDETLCIAAGLMGYFHDIIQGLDGFPSTGKSENVTAKFISYLIEEASQSIEIDHETGLALKRLADATIIGGTFLIHFETEEGRKNQTPETCLDYSDLKETVNERDFSNLSEIRKILTLNDISRTQDSNYSNPLDKIGLDESTASGRIVGRCYDAEADAFIHRTRAIENNLAFKKLSLPSHQFARICQSIRILIEIQSNKQELMFSERAIVDYFRNKRAPEESFEKEIANLKVLLSDPTTWIGGIKNGKNISGEAQFAIASDHDEYARLISESKFIHLIDSLSKEEFLDLIDCAVSKIQDGKYIREFLCLYHRL